MRQVSAASRSLASCVASSAPSRNSSASMATIRPWASVAASLASSRRSGHAWRPASRRTFESFLKGEGVAGAPEVDLSGGSAQIATALWNQIDAETLVDRGVLVAGDPESCLRSIAIHEVAGVDELQFLMATETVLHDKVTSSIELFGTHVIPELKKRGARRDGC